MELLTEFMAFISWLWYFGWRIFLGLILLFILIGTVVTVYQERRMRKYVGDPLDWLTVMSDARWDTRGDLAEYMNAKFRHEIFKVRQDRGRLWGTFYHKHLFTTDLVMILDDLSYLEDEGLIENRIRYLNREGKEVSGILLSPTDKMSGDYLRRDEYRKTEKGNGIKRKRKEFPKSADIPTRELGTQT